MGSSAKQIHPYIPTMRVFLFSVLLAIASSTPIPDSPPEPYNAPSYAYKYTVDDGPYGPVFSHGENRENYNTKGEYQVNLPDGRVATVTYTVDGPSGFIADVKYDGVSVYPDAPPAYHPAPAPAYAPAPAEPAAEEPAPEIDLRAEAAPAPEPAAPVYAPAPAPVYKPAPASVYKPAPSPYGEARQILTPDSSVKKYSFKILEPVEEARQSKAIEPQTNSINEVIPDYDDDEEISTEGALIEEIATEEIIIPAEEIILVEQIATTEVPIEEEIIVISPIEEIVLVEEPEIIEEIIEEVTEEANSVFEEIVLPTVEAAPIAEAAAPIQEAAPIVEAAPIIEAVPIIEADPIIEAAPVQEAAPIIEAAPIVQAAPVFQVQ